MDKILSDLGVKNHLQVISASISFTTVEPKRKKINMHLISVAVRAKEPLLSIVSGGVNK